MSTIDWGQDAPTADDLDLDPHLKAKVTEPEATPEPAPGLGLRDQNLRFALLKAVADGINTELAAERTDHTHGLVERYVDEGTKSFDVKLPDGTKVAAIALSVPKASTEVVDEDALVKWATENAAWLLKEHPVPAVSEQVIPAQPARVEQVIDPAALTEWLKTVKPVTPTGGPVVDPDTGAIVEGIVHTPEGTPRSFSVRYATDGRDDLARAWRAGALEHLTAGSVLPAIDEKPF